MKYKELFDTAKWVSPNGKSDTPYIRGEFITKNDVKSAQITICGLGFFELTINGEKVSDDLFAPANTDYHPADRHCTKEYGEILSHRIYSMRYDIKEYLDSKNCIGITLGPGWYKNDGYDTFGWNFSYGEVKLTFKIDIEYTDGEREEIVSSTENLKWTQSPYVISRIKKGDYQDFNTYRLDGWNLYGFDDSEWNNLEVVEIPETEFYVQDCPSDKVIRNIKPKLIKETDDGFIYDMGENITGTPVIKAKTKDICKIDLVCSERLDEQGNIEDYTTHGQKSTFVTDGTDREYKLKFAIYAFRYAMVSKNAEIIDCEVIHTDLPVTSSFKCDNEILNWYYDAYIRTQLDNIHCCVPSDCPHIERLGYTGDGELTCECAMMMLDSENMYRKWIEDISDCQDTVSGHVQYTAPYSQSGGGPGGWGCAIIEVPYTFYKIFGDMSVLEKFIPKTLNYFDYLDAHSENDLVISDQPGLWCLGDWCTPEEIAIPQPFVNNYFYIKSINRVLEYCELTNNSELSKKMEELKTRKVKALIDNYFDSETGNFANNIQGANAFAYDIGLGDERTFANIVKRYKEYGMYDTGIFGTDIVTRVLFENGQEQLAYNLMTSEKLYSFSTWMKAGSTTLPEYWTFKRSQNHPMFGAVAKYLFTHLLGIVNDDNAYESVTIEPKFVDGLNCAEGYLIVKNGKIGVKYEKTESSIHMEIEIPENTTAILSYKDKIYELECGLTKFILSK